MCSGIIGYQIVFRFRIIPSEKARCSLSVLDNPCEPGLAARMTCFGTLPRLNFRKDCFVNETPCHTHAHTRTHTLTANSRCSSSQNIIIRCVASEYHMAFYVSRNRASHQLKPKMLPSEDEFFMQFHFQQCFLCCATRSPRLDFVLDGTFPNCDRSFPLQMHTAHAL
jgi:hypothetical protein